MSFSLPQESFSHVSYFANLPLFSEFIRCLHFFAFSAPFFLLEQKLRAGRKVCASQNRSQKQLAIWTTLNFDANYLYIRQWNRNVSLFISLYDVGILMFCFYICAACFESYHGCPSAIIVLLINFKIIFPQWTRRIVICAFIYFYIFRFCYLESR